MFNTRYCFKDTLSIPFDYCILVKDDSIGQLFCRCNCRNHLCNSYNPDCQTENLFFLTDQTKVYAFHAAFESNSKDFLDYMKKTYKQGNVANLSKIV